MIKISQIDNGLWHIEKFLPDFIWEKIDNQILALLDEEYTDNQEPMRLRLEILNPTLPLYKYLVQYSTNTTKLVSSITQHKNLRNPPGLFLWRDFEGFLSNWHTDDFTMLPTAQIYVDGDMDQGTSFKFGQKTFTIPLKPNTGYLMDNRYQIEHGMLTSVEKKIRQSIYLIY